MEEVDLEIVAQICTVVFAILTLYFGTQYSQARSLLRELGEAISVTEVYLSSPVIDQEMLRDCLKEWRDVIDSARALMRWEGGRGGNILKMLR